MTLKLLPIWIVCVSAALLAQDPPSRVARLNWIQGSVSFQPASLDNWTSATLNYPLTTGDHIYADAGSRAEMHIGPNAIRLDSQSNFGFLNLDDLTVQMHFTDGAMEVRLKALGDQEVYEVDTPNGAISLLRSGDYRIDTDPDRNATMVTVMAGEAEVTAEGNSFSVRPRQTAWFSGGGAPDIRSANAPDDFDRFTYDRNAREDRLPPPQHVPPAMVGYEDLDTYGAWREVPDYGWVWAPPVQAGWVPYRVGHWAWVEPWGWTWIDDAPWGFAPFHYGRWAFAGGSWIWIPGAVAVRPVYAPALVAFVGGPRFSVAIGAGGGPAAVAWFPLGPREVYRPAYRVSEVYVRNVNVAHVTNITNITNVNVTNVRYVNQNVQGAVTVVPQAAFLGARPVHEAAQRVTAQQIAQAQVTGMAPQIRPGPESVMGTSRANLRVAEPRAAIVNREVVVKSTPPPRALVNRPPVRAAAAPPPVNNPQPGVSRPAFQNPPPAVAPPALGRRLDSRPPNGRPVEPDAAPPAAAPPAAPPNRNRPEFNRPEINRPEPAPRPQREQPPNRPQFERRETTPPAARPNNPPPPQPPAPQPQREQPPNRPHFERRENTPPAARLNNPPPPQPPVNRPAPSQERREPPRREDNRKDGKDR
jgi:hypothetical protein